MKSNVPNVATVKRRRITTNSNVVVPPKWAHVTTTTTTTDPYDDGTDDDSYKQRKGARTYQNNTYDMEGNAVHEEEDEEDVRTCAYQTITIQYLHNMLLRNTLQQSFVHGAVQCGVGGVSSSNTSHTTQTTATTTTTIMNDICQFLSSTTPTIRPIDANTTNTTTATTTTTTTANATSATTPTTTTTTDIAATTFLGDIATATTTTKGFDESTTRRNNEDTDDNGGIERENVPGGTLTEGNTSIEGEFQVIINETLSKQQADERIDDDIIYNKYMIPFTLSNDNSSCNATNASETNHSNSNNSRCCAYTYDPLLLPIVMIENGPFAYHDRQFVLSYIMQTMQQEQQQQQQTCISNKNQCCVWLTLPSQSSNIYKMTNRTLYQEIVCQCWKQEIQMKMKMQPQQQQQQHKQNNTTNTTTSTSTIDQLVQQQLKQISSLSITEQLLLFASQTQYFNSIIIFWFIEHGNILYNHHHHSNNDSISFEIFVKWCNERRSYYGIPISIIMYNPAATTNNHYRRSIPYHSTNIQSSIAGLRVRTINSLPTNTILLQTMLQHLYHDAISDTNMSSISPTTTTTTKSTTGPRVSCFALFIIRLCYSRQPKTMANIWYLYQYTDHSIVRLLHSFEEMICHYFSSSTSLTSTKFTLFINAVTIILASLSNIQTNAHARRRSTYITSLFYDHSFRRMISCVQSNNNDDDNHNVGGTTFSSNKLFQHLEAFEVDRYMSSLAIQLYSMIWDKFLVQVVHSMIPTVTFPVWLVFGHAAVVHDSPQNTRVWYDTLHTLLNDNDRRSMIEMVAKFRTVCDIASTTIFNKLALFAEEHIDHQNNIRNGVLSSCNELIVLLDHCTTIYDVQRCLRSLILINTGMDVVDSVMNETATSDNNNIDSCCRIPLPRRDYVSALMTTINTSSNDDNDNNSISLADVPGRMYQIIQDRVQISEMDWYDLFLNQYSKDEIESMMRCHNVFHVFGYGTYHLQLSGLVRRIEGKNGSIQYERTALVWCGGE